MTSHRFVPVYATTSKWTTIIKLLYRYDCIIYVFNSVIYHLKYVQTIPLKNTVSETTTDRPVYYIYIYKTHYERVCILISF